MKTGYEICEDIEMDAESGVLRTIVGGPNGFFIMRRREGQDKLRRTTSDGLILETSDLDYAAIGASFYATLDDARRAVASEIARFRGE